MVQTQYMEMLLQLDQSPSLRNFMTSLFTWILLAGYLVFPGTFTSLRNSTEVKVTAGSSNTEGHVVSTVQNVPLPWLAAICCICGKSGLCL